MLLLIGHYVHKPVVNTFCLPSSAYKAHSCTEEIPFGNDVDERHESQTEQ